MSNAVREARNYDIRLLETSPGDLKEVLDLFIQGGSGMSDTIEFLDWQYNQNPRGPAVGFNAYFEGELAAHYVAIPVMANLFGAPVRGLLSVNTRTAARHQGQGLFTRLAHATYEHAQSNGYEFVVGVANDSSVHGFTKKLGFQHVGMMRTWFTTAPRWQEAALDYETSWDADSVRWRLSNPTRSYSVLRRGDRALLFGQSKRFRVLMGDVKAATVPPEVPAPPESLNPFSMWLGVSTASQRGGIRLPVPDRMKETSLHLIFRDLAGERALSADRTRFWAMDFDAY